MTNRGGNMTHSRTLLVSIGVMLCLMAGCRKDNPTTSTNSSTPIDPVWKNSNYQTVDYRYYSIGTTSNYTPVGQIDTTRYDCIKDSVTFHQKLAYARVSWDSTYIPGTVFNYQCGILVSDIWDSQYVDYFVKGLYLYNNGLYIDYQRTPLPVNNPQTPVLKSFIFILFNSNVADSLMLIENNTAKTKFYVH